jgi:hypothetical protein
MNACQGCLRLLRRSARTARRTTTALSAAGQRLAERLAYRPREVVVVGLLAAGLFGGLAVERWRARHPVTADRLEAEPAGSTTSPPVQPAPRPRPRSVSARCETGDRASWPGRGDAGPVWPRLDLNQVTPGELARVAGISWRLAARIVAARDAFEGREGGRSYPDGAGAATVSEPSAPDTDQRPAPAVTPDADSP